MESLMVGIHENIHVSNESKINDKGSLEILLKSAASKKTDAEIWEAVEQNEAFEEAQQKIMIFPFGVHGWNTDSKSWSVPKTFNTILVELKDLESTLIRILRVYITNDKIAKYLGGKVKFDKTGINKDNFKERLLDEAVLHQVQNNIFNNFLKACKENDIFDSEKLFRIKLARQSATKHFPKIPGIKDNWIEAMDAFPKKQSKISWSKWEVENGRTNSEPLAATNVPVEETTEAKDLFKNTDEEEPVQD